LEAVNYQLEGRRGNILLQVAEGAGKKRKEGGKKGGEASQITARAGAAKQGAPADASGQASNLDAVNWRIMGAEEGCRDQTQQQITVSFDLIVSCSK